MARQIKVISTGLTPCRFAKTYGLHKNSIYHRLKHTEPSRRLSLDDHGHIILDEVALGLIQARTLGMTPGRLPKTQPQG